MGQKKTKLGKNIFYQLFYQIVVILAPLIVTPYLSRVLGPAELGKYSYAYSIAYYFVLVGTLGITSHGSRQIAAVKDDSDKLNQTFSNLFWLHGISATIVTLVYLVFVIGFINKNKTIALIMTLYVASTMFDVKWLFYGLENFKIVVARNLIIKVCSIVAIFAFVKTRDDVNAYSLIMAGISFFAAEFSLFLIFPKNVKIRKPQWKAFGQELLPLLIMFIPTAATMICRHIDKVMLGMMSTLDQVGLYENTDKVYLMLVTVITTVGDVMLPRMSNLFANGEKEEADKLFFYSLRICIITACAFMFGITAIADEFVPVFFGDEFLGCIKLLQYISPTILMLAWSATVRKQYLVPRYKNKVFVISMIVGTAVNIIANSILISKYDALGAVYGTLIAEFVIVILQVVMTKNEIKYWPYLKETIVFCVIGALMYFGVRRVAAIMNSHAVIQLVIEILVGVILYSASTLLYFIIAKDEMFGILKRVFLKHRKL